MAGDLVQEIQRADGVIDEVDPAAVRRYRQAEQRARSARGDRHRGCRASLAPCFCQHCFASTVSPALFLAPYGFPVDMVKERRRTTEYGKGAAGDGSFLNLNEI